MPQTVMIEREAATLRPVPGGLVNHAGTKKLPETRSQSHSRLRLRRRQRSGASKGTHDSELGVQLFLKHTLRLSWPCPECKSRATGPSMTPRYSGRPYCLTTYSAMQLWLAVWHGRPGALTRALKHRPHCDGYPSTSSTAEPKSPGGYIVPNIPYYTVPYRTWTHVNPTPTPHPWKPASTHEFLELIDSDRDTRRSKLRVLASQRTSDSSFKSSPRARVLFLSCCLLSAPSRPARHNGCPRRGSTHHSQQAARSGLQHHWQ